MLASFLLLALLAAAGNPAPSTAQPAPRISVVFVEPEKFTEMRYSEAERYSPAILLQLQRFIVETGADSLPEPLRLEVRITDIDMAGDFELFRGPVRDQVRVIKSSYPPRIALEFRVIETPERVVKEGSAS